MAPSPQPRPEVIGHRGAAAHAPGNSRAAFHTALDLGVDRIACDVRRSADGALVLVHDERVTLEDGENRRVDRLTLPELRALLPDLLTLDGLAELVGGRVALMIDLKATGYE